MSIFTITEKHGKNMYINGVKHAIAMFELAGEDAIPKLKKTIEETEAEVRKIEKQEEREKVANAA